MLEHNEDDDDEEEESDQDESSEESLEGQIDMLLDFTFRDDAQQEEDSE